MTNDNNNINELVADDDDPTVELAIPMFRQVTAETDAKTYDADNVDERDALSSATARGLSAELRARQDSIDRLQFDFEQLHSKWLGLESEAQARAGQSEQLNQQLTAAQERFQRKEKLIKKRDRKIKLLKTEIRQRDEEQRKLVNRCDDLQTSLDNSLHIREENDTDLSRQELTESDLRQRLTRSDDYADSIRRQLQDLMESGSHANREIDYLSTALESKTQKVLELVDHHTESVLQVEELQGKLDSIQAEHEREIRTLRFELGAAENTMVEAENIKTQLASDLVDAQEFKVNLQKKLSETEEHSASSLADLREENTKLARANRSFEQKLTAKSLAITVLLAELAKMSGQVKSAQSIDDACNFEDQASEQYGKPDVNESRSGTDQKVSRVLVGSVDNQVLRFPLFKDRLTIGRTKENDIQLEAAYVSRRHAVIQKDDETTRIIDWGSKNGIHVNSKRIDEHFLKHGDVVIIGKARFRYEEHKKRES